MADAPDSPEFLAAQRRAALRDGVLFGMYVLVDGEFLRQAGAAWRPEGVHVAASAGSPGATAHYPGFWTIVVPHDHVAAAVRFTTTARHRGGAVLELTAPASDGVRAIWWRGLNDDAGETIPAGFRWEKNDDYYYGTVGWAELDDMAVSAELRPR
ncbi:hypothetical protein ACPCHT_29830 [Nucisporomicrobium flavum]|uniref:hypothetical protein n=1 Tax=Nucisporomicrobium flavum TaxID=2785915 RepID=UPI003C2CCCBD